MRSMVRVLRTDGGVEYSPQPGLADVAALARTRATPRVEVAVDPALPPLSPQGGTALYRIAQESLTNALRHARGATRVAIDVRREGGTVRLRVRDDGRTEHGSPPRPGFGLLGMAERVELLGGSFAAGPEPARGWEVDGSAGDATGAMHTLQSHCVPDAPSP
jgi:signal transduction histidine kinase